MENITYSYYIVLHKTLYSTLYGKYQPKSPTIYSILSTHYDILNQSMNFTLGHVLCHVNPYYGLISAPGMQPTRT